MYRLLLALAALLLSGCALTQLGGTSTTVTTTDPQEDIPTTAATPSGTAEDDAAPCLAGDRPFAGDGVISAFGGANGDATQVSGIRWASHDGCERIVVDLLTADGAPAGAIDPVGVDYNAERGVIRVNLPRAITRSAIADSFFDGDLAGRVYVVSGPNEQMAIDVHITPDSTIALRAFEIDSPSRVIIDMKEEENAPQVVGAAASTQIVLLSPMATWTEPTVEVAGYARGGQSELNLRVFDDPESEPLLERTIALDGDTGLWQEFELRLTGLPARPLELQIEARGGSQDSIVRVAFDTSDQEVPDPPEV